MTNAEYREIRAIKKKLGMCTHCKNDVVPKLTLCQRHREKAVVASTKWRNKNK